MSENITVLVAHPKAAQFRQFRRLWHDGDLPLLSLEKVSIAFVWVKRPVDLQREVVEHHPDILVVHGSLLGDLPAQAVMWVLVHGTAGVLITDDSDRSRQFKTKRCHILPVLGAAETTAAALAAEVRRVQGERRRRDG